MAQDIERVDNYSGVAREEGVSQVVRSNPENGRSRRARTLKEKEEEELAKKRRRRKADRVELSHETEDDETEREDEKQEDEKQEDAPTLEDEASHRNEDTDEEQEPPAGIDLRA